MYWNIRVCKSHDILFVDKSRDDVIIDELDTDAIADESLAIFFAVQCIHLLKKREEQKGCSAKGSYNKYKYFNSLFLMGR